MRLDSLQKYISLREELTREKQNLEQRLSAINNAFGEASSVPSESSARKSAKPVAVRSTQPLARVIVRRGRPAKGGVSLREVVLQVLASGPKSKEQILAGVQNFGYRFSTSDPMNSLGVILYGKNPKFNRVNGQFSLGKSSSSSNSSTAVSNTNGSSVNTPKGRRGGRRPMSPEGRERIAAAQRARWAKAKNGK